MTYTEKTRIGIIFKNEAARAVLIRRLPDLASSPPHMLSLFKSLTLEKVYAFRQEELGQPDWIADTLAELAGVASDSGVAEPDADVEVARSADYEPADVPEASAAVQAPAEAEQWGIYEIELKGPSHGNPFTDVELAAEFKFGGKSVRMAGFYDGDGVYRIRFMPDAQGDWTYRTASSARSLNGIEGAFRVVPPSAGNHGPVRVKDTYHFAYEDGTSYIPVGTTCYAWTHQGEELEAQTLETLKASPFNKMRMCVFPKSYLFNENEPVYDPFEGSLAQGWDYTRFNPVFFRHLEDRIADLGKLGIEADLILFHAYDRWGYSEMSPAADDRYLRYITARLSAYRNVWWSLANEYDLMWNKEPADWERFAEIVTTNDPAGHLISNHNCFAFYDYSKPWVTHCSIQRVDVYKTSEATTEWRERWKKPIVIDECAYEGDIDQGWGNITGEEMTRRFWEGAIRGGYVGHGETYLNPEEVLWWSKGGKLTGTSPDRISFLRRIVEESPGGVLNPLPSDWDVPCAGEKDEYYLYYFGFNQPRFRNFSRKPGTKYNVDVIDTWNMTVERLEGTYEGAFRIELPGRQFMAVRMSKAE
ncbi:DUF5605 domain-containing protein [Cohnella rhizosphaerae]|uniref:DUF5605 domain-containing protein n=1 Tax=Cohnella rhizosphaerae TaxID=1457232 RepID=A0A9X4QT09_9BACL|nr:DUF5605 domain-containing protein [Cohnella rhizosphaerae]MDG0809863.1 DUF5605 domain-containing protein [Cohnella rhizosphaerae]